MIWGTFVRTDRKSDDKGIEYTYGWSIVYESL